jgi:TusA-related sulfurtransferase
MKAKLKELEPGQVLLVRVDDPSARLDVEAWCAITGNSLLATAEEENGVLCFFVKKSEKKGRGE